MGVGEYGCVKFLHFVPCETLLSGFHTISFAVVGAKISPFEAITTGMNRAPESDNYLDFPGPQKIEQRWNLSAFIRGIA